MKKLNTIFFVLIAIIGGYFNSSAQCTRFNTPGTSTYTVPAGVTSLRIAARGADGGQATPSTTHGNSGAGATIIITFPVQVGDVITNYIGSAGSFNAANGICGGGGATGVVHTRGTTNTLLVVAGGGGGGSRVINGFPNPGGGGGRSTTNIAASGGTGFIFSASVGAGGGGYGFNGTDPSNYATLYGRSQTVIPASGTLPAIAVGGTFNGDANVVAGGNGFGGGGGGRSSGGGGGGGYAGGNGCNLSNSVASFGGSSYVAPSAAIVKQIDGEAGGLNTTAGSKGANGEVNIQPLTGGAYTNVWHGTFGTQTENPRNWCGFGLEKNLDALVLNGTLMSPINSLTDSCRKLTVGPNASFSIVGTLVLLDSLKNAGTVNATNGRIIVNSNNDFSIDTANFFNSTVRQLGINISSGTFRINKKLIVTDSLGIGSIGSGSIANTDTLELKKNFANNGLGNITTNFGTLVFSGTTPQTIPINTLVGPQTRNLVINNPAGVTANFNLMIINDLRLQNGKLTIPEPNYLNMINGSFVSQHSANSYIAGQCRKAGNVAFTFPIGSATKYAPISISAPTSTSDSYQALYTFSSPTNVAMSHVSVGVGLQRASNTEYWSLMKTAGSSTLRVILSWDSTRSGGITNTSDLRVARWDGSTWNNMGNTIVTGNTKLGTITSTPGIAVSLLDYFTLATSSFANTLPIVLNRFTVNSKEKTALLQWQSKAEINAFEYQIERSTNGVSFEKVNTVAAVGKANDYSFVDNRLPTNATTIYYRLRLVDADGKYSYSEVRTLNVINVKLLNVYPNSAKGGKLNVDYGEDVSNNTLYTITTVDGRMVQQGILVNRQQTINTSSLKPATYMLKIGSKKPVMFVSE